jgi:hypothetical protein
MPCRCCCPDYYMSTLNGIGSGSTQGWRRLRTTGDYPNNSFNFELTPHSNTGVTTTLSTCFGVDIRNKFAFSTHRQTPSVISIYARDEKFKQNPFNLVSMTGAVGGGLPSGIFCWDWKYQRLYYVKGISNTNNGDGTSTAIQEIRRIDYNGQNDTLVTTDTHTASNASTFGTGIVSLAWDPVNDYLFYTQFKFFFWGGIDTNVGYYVKRLKTDGTGLTTIVTLENTTNTAGDFTLRSLGISAKRQRLVWVKDAQVGTAGAFTSTRYLETLNFNGSDIQTLWSEAQFANPSIPAPVHEPVRCMVDEENDIIHIEDFHSSGIQYTRRWAVPWDSVDASTWELKWATNQPAYLSYGWDSAPQPRAVFGCRERHTGTYSGGSQSI